MTLAELRAKKKAKAAEIRAKIAELDAATGDAVAPLKAAHDALVAEYDSLAERESRLVAAERRDAEIAAGERSTSTVTAGAGGDSITGGSGGDTITGAAATEVISATDGLALIDEARAYGAEVETEIRAAVAKPGAKAADVRQQMLTAAAERQRRQTGGVQGTGARVTTDERQTRREAVESALLHRYAPSRYQLSDAGRQYRGMSLIEIGRDLLEAQNVSTRGLNRNEIAERSLMATSDFPLTLANVTNRTLRDAYEAAPRTFLPIARQVTLSDFKAAHRVKLGDAPQLLEVMENGEFKRGAMNEGDEQIKLRTYGRVVGITRQVLINDDLGAFTRIPEMFGSSVANLESNVVWGLIMANPALLTDNTALFHAKHNNLLTGGPSALSADAIAKARVNMAKQVGDGENPSVLNIRPKFLVVPTELEVPAQQILFGITPNTTAAVVPEAIRSLTPISEPRLSTGINGVNGSATAWYLFADPSTIDGIEYAYLEGQAGPYTETRNGFDVDGMEVKCRHDFGAAAIDYRGVAKSNGA